MLIGLAVRRKRKSETLLAVKKYEVEKKRKQTILISVHRKQKMRA